LSCQAALGGRILLGCLAVLVLVAQPVLIRIRTVDIIAVLATISILACQGWGCQQACQQQN
jgi:hypothetical protein